VFYIKFRFPLCKVNIIYKQIAQNSIRLSFRNKVVNKDNYTINKA